jgi:hypothetical protein
MLGRPSEFQDTRGFELNPELRSYLVEHFDEWRDNEAKAA